MSACFRLIFAHADALNELLHRQGRLLRNAGGFCSARKKGNCWNRRWTLPSLYLGNLSNIKHVVCSGNDLLEEMPLGSLVF